MKRDTGKEKRPYEEEEEQKVLLPVETAQTPVMLALLAIHLVQPEGLQMKTITFQKWMTW